MSGDVVARAKVAMAAVGAGSIGNLIALVPELVAEVERLQGENLTLHESAVHWRGLWQQNTATASAAIAERDAANAEVEKLEP